MFPAFRAHRVRKNQMNFYFEKKTIRVVCIHEYVLFVMNKLRTAGLLWLFVVQQLIVLDRDIILHPRRLLDFHPSFILEIRRKCEIR